MRVVIAPQSLKGSLSAAEAGQAIAAGVRAVYPEAAMDVMPVADGGKVFLRPRPTAARIGDDSRIVRMTLSFSKSVVMHEACFLLFLHRYNRDRAILLT